MTKRASYPELAHWLREQQSAGREIEAATQDAAKWLERARLAKRADNQTLVEAATAQMTNVRARHQKAKDRLLLICALAYVFIVILGQFGEKAEVDCFLKVNTCENGSFPCIDTGLSG